MRGERIRLGELGKVETEESSLVGIFDGLGGFEKSCLEFPLFERNMESPLNRGKLERIPL